MSDYVLKSPDRASFLQAAYALGFAQADAQGALHLVTTGVTQDGGNYFINEVGEVRQPTGETIDGPFGPQPVMAPIPGHWSRIRVNNGGALPAVPAGFELFEPVRYLADGETPDPAYVQPPYGQIA